LFDVLVAPPELDLPVLFVAHPQCGLCSIERFAADRSERDSACSAVDTLQSLALTQGAAAVVTDSGVCSERRISSACPVSMFAKKRNGWTLDVEANRLVRTSVALRELELAGLWEGAQTKPWNRSAFGSGDAACRLASGRIAWLETRK
jgi:hypothetical protein